MGRVAESREALSSLRDAAEQYRVTRNRARSEALIAAERKIEAQRQELQRRIVETINAKHAISAISDATGLGRSTIYKWRDEYLDLFGDVVPDTSLWKITVPDDTSEFEYVAVHPDLGAFNAVFELDGSLTVWRADGTYRPISREKDDTRDGGDWTNEMETMYPQLMELRATNLENGDQG